MKSLFLITIYHFKGQNQSPFLCSLSHQTTVTVIKQGSPGVYSSFILYHHTVLSTQFYLRVSDHLIFNDYMDKYLLHDWSLEIHILCEEKCLQLLDSSNWASAYIKKKTMAQGLKQFYSMPSCCTACHHSNASTISPLFISHTKV